MLLTGHESEIFSCKFSSQGDILASTGFDRKIFLWNVYGECENFAVMTGHSGAVLDLKFNHDGSEIVTCSTDKSIMIWDLSTCERSKKIRTNHSNYINSIDTSRTSSPQLICSGSDDNMVKVWDRRKKGEIMSFDSKYQVLSVAFNNSAEQVFSSGVDNAVKCWDMRKNGLLYQLNGHTDSPTGLSLSPDGNFLASNAMDSTIRVWDVRPYASQERCLKVLRGHSHNFEKNLLKASWSPDGEMIAGGSADKHVYIWEFASGKILFKLPGHIGSVNETAFHPQEPIIASCSSDRRIYLGELP